MQVLITKENASDIIKFLGCIFLFLGIFIFPTEVAQGLQAFHTRETLLLVIAVLCILGGIGFLLKKRWGLWMVYGVSIPITWWALDSDPQNAWLFIIAWFGVVTSIYGISRYLQR